MKGILLLLRFAAEVFFIKAGNFDSGGEAHIGAGGPPLGHMQELGSHSDPLPVEERWDFPHPHEFWEKYVKGSRAVVFREAAKRSPAFTKWTEEYLKETYPDLEVRLETKREKEGYVAVGDKGMGRDTLKNFFKTYKKNDREGDKYIVSELPTPMWHEYMVLPSLSCGLFKRNFVEIDLWFSSGGTSSILHKDAFNQLNCLINGTKEWKLIEYKYEKEIYKAYEPGDPGGGYSRINVTHVDMIKYPKISQVPWNFTVINKGDCLFLPKSMYHQVKSYGSMNLAISILFSRFEHLNPDKVTAKSFRDCDTDKPRFRPLSEFDVDLQYPGKGMMTMGYSELTGTTITLLSLVREYGQITKEVIASAIRFEKYFRLPGVTHDEAVQKRQEDIDEAFNLLTGGDPNKKVDRKAVLKLPRPALRKVSLMMQETLVSNVYDYEYYKMNPLHIAKILAVLVKSGSSTVKRDEFIKAYVDRLYGSKQFGEQFWNDLAGDGAESVSKAKIMANFSNASRKYSPQEEERWQEVEGKPQYDDWREDPGEAYIYVRRDTAGEKDEELLTELKQQLLARQVERQKWMMEGDEGEAEEEAEGEEQNKTDNKETKDDKHDEL